jgi:hypothetical protein
MRVFLRKGLVANPLCGFAYGNPAEAPAAFRGIGAESPTPLSGDAPKKPKIKANTRFQPRMLTAFFKP